MYDSLTKFGLLLLLLLSQTVYCDENQVTNKKKVCVIGAGPCGLASVRQLSTLPDEFVPVVFERNTDVGGLWIYTDKTDFDEHGLPVHSSMYKNLRTNAPKELMSYPDYREFYGEQHSCVSHKTVLEYLRNYTDHFDLRQYIQFNTFVETVIPLTKDDNVKWLVKTRSLNTGSLEETECNAVMICNGNLFQPNVPKIPGIQQFPGRLLHSHSYRKPEEFAGQSVVILGASFSGTDIAIEISKYAKHVYLSHRHDKIASELPSNIQQVAGVVNVNGDKLILSDDTSITVDSFVLCTGYEYSFPFLDATSGIVVDNGKYIHPLYKQLINVNHTSMSVLGIPRDNVGFSTYDIQARYFLSVLRSKVKLPSYDEMLKDSVLPSGGQLNHVHDFGDHQWSYYADLAGEGGFENLPKFYENGFNKWISFYDENLLTFRGNDLRVIDDEQVEIVRWENT